MRRALGALILLRLVLLVGCPAPLHVWEDGSWVRGTAHGCIPGQACDS